MATRGEHIEMKLLVILAVAGGENAPMYEKGHHLNLIDLIDFRDQLNVALHTFLFSCSANMNTDTDTNISFSFLTALAALPILPS